MHSRGDRYYEDIERDGNAFILTVRPDPDGPTYETRLTIGDPLSARRVNPPPAAS